MTEHRHHRALHCEMELAPFQPLLKQVEDAEVLSVPPLDLCLVKNRSSRSKAREVLATKSTYIGHFLALDTFPAQSTEKRCKCLRRNSVSVPLSLTCWWPNVVEGCLRLCNTKTIIYLNLGQLKLHSYIH